MNDLNKFKEYCESNGISGTYSEDQNSFYCFSKQAKITSFLIARFTSWKDGYNESKREYDHYEFRLSKKDTQNDDITGRFFEREELQSA